MPYIKVKEIDSTIYNPITNNSDNIVFIPGSASTGPVNEPTLVSSYDEFISIFGDTGSSWEYAVNMLLSGFSVLFVRLGNDSMTVAYGSLKYTVGQASITMKAEAVYPGTFGNYLTCKLDISSSYIDLVVSKSGIIIERTRLVDLSQGDDVITKLTTALDNPVKTRYVKLAKDTETTLASDVTTVTLEHGTDISSSTTLESLLSTFLENKKEELIDRNLNDIKFLTSGGICVSTPSSTDINNKMIDIAETRKDCIALVDIPFGTPISNVISWVSNYNSSYATAYAPWCNISLGTGSDKWMPPSFIFLYTLSKSINSGNKLWMPPAGVRRALIPEISNVEYAISQTTLDLWQNKEAPYVNPIMYLRNYGYVIYGQRTLYTKIPSPLGTRSALQELTVRLTANEIKRAIVRVSTGLTFEQNNIRTWNEFRGALDPYLAQMKADGGINDYEIVLNDNTTTESDIEQNTIRGIVRASIARAAENFEIDFEITAATVTFSDIGDEITV